MLCEGPHSSLQAQMPPPDYPATTLWVPIAEVWCRYSTPCAVPKFRVAGGLIASVQHWEMHHCPGDCTSNQGF